MGSDPDRYHQIQATLTSAAQAVDRAGAVFDGAPREPALLGATLAGAVATTRALIELLDRLIAGCDQPARCDLSPSAAAETLADLQALRHCLHTSTLLAKPALTDLRAPSGTVHMRWPVRPATGAAATSG